MKYYHLTRTKNVPRILRKGLRVGGTGGLSEKLLIGKERRGRPEPLTRESLIQERGFTYLADDLDTLGELVAALSYQVRKSARYSVLQIEAPGTLETSEDTDTLGYSKSYIPGGYQTTSSYIPPGHISVVGTLVVRPKLEPVYLVGDRVASQLGEGFKGWKAASVLEGGEEEFPGELRQRVEELPRSGRFWRQLEEYRDEFEEDEE